MLLWRDGNSQVMSSNWFSLGIVSSPKRLAIVNWLVYFLPHAFSHLNTIWQTSSEVSSTIKTWLMRCKSFWQVLPPHSSWWVTHYGQRTSPSKVPSFDHFTIVKVTVILGPLKAVEMVLYICPHLWLISIYCVGLQSISLTAWLGICPHMHCPSTSRIGVLCMHKNVADLYLQETMYRTANNIFHDQFKIPDKKREVK